MAIYRISRNLEASLIQYIEAELVSVNWKNTTVEKSFAKVYNIPVNTFQKQGAICVRLSDASHDPVQIGDNSTVRNPLVLIDLFCPNDGFKLDLKDILISVLRAGCPYYECETDGKNAFISKTQNGRIKVKNLRDTEVNLGVDKSLLEVHDRYRWLITANLFTGKIEV